MNSSKSKIRHIHQANMLLEQRMLNDKRILTEQAASDGWLTYGNDKNYQYKKVGNDWVTKNLKTNKEYNLTQLSKNPKYAAYKTSISNLEKTYPGGKPKVNANANSNVNGTGDVINTLPQKPLQTLDGKPVASSPTPLNTGGNTQPVQYKNEKLPDAPVYYPWIQDGKLNTEKLKQSIEDNSINKWLDELKKLTPEQLTKVRQDLKSSGIPTNLTTTKGTGLYYNLIELLKVAEKSIQTNNNNNDISGSNNPQQNFA